MPARREGLGRGWKSWVLGPDPRWRHICAGPGLGPGGKVDAVTTARGKRPGIDGYVVTGVSEIGQYGHLWASSLTRGVDSAGTHRQAHPGKRDSGGE